MSEILIRGLDNRSRFVEKMNTDFGSLNIREDIDDITSECYEHWLASVENVCELNLTIVDRRLSLGPRDKPMVSFNKILGAQLDGGCNRTGLYRVNETTLANKTNLQPSRVSRNNGFDDFTSICYLIRIFVLHGEEWKISSTGVYYQLKGVCGKRKISHFTVTEKACQTDLTGDELQKVLDDRIPKCPVVDKGS